MLHTKHILIAVTAVLVLAATSTLVLAQDTSSAQEETAKLIAVLKSDAAMFDKAKACQRLAVIGTKDAVPVLAALLYDEKLSHYARYGLEPISDPAVDEAFRDATGKLKGKLLVGVINSIGNRKDARAVDGLSKFLTDSDPEVVAAAAAALGRIGGTQAAKTLQQSLPKAPTAMKPQLADACIVCAETLLTQNKREEAVAMYDAVRTAELPAHLRVAATRGAILTRQSAGIPVLVEQLKADDPAMFGVGLRTARELAGADVTRAMVAHLDNLSPPRRALLILALGDRGDSAALPAVLEAAKAGPTEVRVAAIRVLMQLGSAAAVPVLLDAAVESEAEVAEAAQATLVGLRGNEVDQSIVAMLGQGDGKIRLVVIDMVGRRRIASAVPMLFKAADAPQQQLRLAAVKALGTTIGLDDLPALTGRIIAPKTPQDKAATQEALKAACIRMSDPEVCAQKLVDCLSGAPVSARCFLLDLLGSVGGTKALNAVSAGARDPNPEIQDAATRVLGGWMNVDAAPELLDLAKTLPAGKFKIRAMRGYIRIVRQLKLPTDRRLAMCRKAMQAAGRNEEKVLVLEVLSRNPSAESLSIVAEHLGNPGLKEQASTAAVSIAEKIVKTNPAEVAEAMKQVLQATKDGKLTGRAKTLLNQAAK